ncbi:hypothetical protein FRB98_005088 [Tulasnella sp. 332]|nr:hypothetical protein FRB98_005088 [Tulasnella sp. 332]
MLKVPRSSLKDAHHRRAVAADNGQDAATTPAAASTPDAATPTTPNSAGSTAAAEANTASAAANTGSTAAASNTATEANTASAAVANTSASAAQQTSAAPSKSVAAASASTKQSSAAVQSTSTPASVVLVTSTSQVSVVANSAASTAIPSTNNIPTTASHPGTITPTGNGYATVTDSSGSTRTYATDNWLSSDIPEASGAAGSSTSGPSVGGIIGIVAACLLALVCAGAGIGFYIRRARRNKRRARFNKSKFVRQSIALKDGPADLNEKAPIAKANDAGLAAAAAGPRPPSMVERRAQAVAATTAAAATAPGPGDVVLDAHGGYYDQAGYYHDAHGQVWDYSQGDQQAQYDYNNGNQQGQYNQYDQYDQHANGTQQHDQYAAGEYQQSDLTRQPSMAPTVASQYPDAQDEYYQDGHASVTPYQQEQYAEINRQLNNDTGAGSGKQLAVPGPAGNGNASVTRSLSTTYTSLNPQQPSKTYNDHSGGDRSGTPTDRNPQQTYFPPTNSNEASPSPSNKYAATTAGRHRTAPTRPAHRDINDDGN